MEFGSREEIENYDIYKPERVGKMSSGQTMVTIMVGIPGSGKSTFARDLSGNGVVYISSDEIREEFFGGEYSRDSNNEVFKIVGEKYEQALKEGKDVILDATHILKKHRKPYIDKAKEYNAYLTAIYMNIDYVTAYERSSKRERQVPKDVIRKMFFDIEDATHEEGFDEICIIDKDGNVSFA